LIHFYKRIQYYIHPDKISTNLPVFKFATNIVAVFTMSQW